jgi:hypothetical protein
LKESLNYIKDKEEIDAKLDHMFKEKKRLQKDLPKIIEEFKGL